jgi:hypothetical protein
MPNRSLRSSRRLAASRSSSTGPTTPHRPERRGRRRLVAAGVGFVVAAAAVVTGVVSGAGVAAPATAATAPAGSPYGVAEHMWFQPGGMYFSGWMLDPSALTTPITAYVVVDGKTLGKTLANRSRPDIAKAYPAAGALHGFSFKVLIPQGKHTVCVRALNIGAGANANLRCQDRDLE